MKNVIIVDDNELSVEGIVEKIDWASLGACVCGTANDGYAALREIEEHRPDLIISDIDMPGMDGIEMCTEALKTVPQAKFLLISAYDKFDYAKRAIRIGVFDYIEKPINYEYLTEKIRGAITILDEEAQNRQIIEESRPVLTRKFFDDLVTYPGANARDEFRNSAEYLHVRTDCPYYNIVRFEIINAREVEASFGVERYQMEVLHLMNMISSSAAMFDWNYSFSKYSEIICCIGQNTRNPDHLLNVLHKFVEEVFNHSENMVIRIHIGIGVIQNNFWNIHVAFENAGNALKYSFYFPQYNIYDANDIESHSFNLTESTDQSDSELLHLIGSGTVNQIDQWLSGYFDRLLSTTPVKSVIFARIYSLVGKIVKFLYETNIDFSDLESEIADLYTRMDSYSSYQELHRWMLNFCTGVQNRLNFSTETYHQQICRQVQEFIDQNFSDNSLNLSDLSKSIGISNAYLSALYKKITGQNINDTITDIRISHACRLLSETEIALKDISGQCGYSNQYYFSSSFKKKMGVSPSAYREQSKTVQNS